MKPKGDSAPEFTSAVWSGVDVLGALLGSVVVGIVLLLCVSSAAHADEKPIEIDAVVANRVEMPMTGDIGEIGLGMAVGYERLYSNDESWGMDGIVEIGCAVGLKLVKLDNWTITFDAGSGSFSQGGTVAQLHGPIGAPVGVPVPDPRRPGWQFSGWHVAGDLDGDWDPEGVSAIPLGDAWDFSKPVTEDMTLYARWEIRLDVTVPVSVAVAVNADTREVISPDAGRYALKSRTVVPVTVEEVAVESVEADVKGFFGLPKDALPDGATIAQEVNAWTRGLMRSWLQLAIARNEAFPSESNAVERVRVGLAARLPEQNDAGYVWVVSRKLSGSLRDSFTLPAFFYGSTPADDSWEGQERCERLGLALDMGISDALEVRLDIDGPVPIIRLKVTVSARP